MTLPLLLSVPHAGLLIPDEVKELVILSEQQIIEDGDEGAAEIYWPLDKEVAAFVTTKVARAIVDLNRAEDDRRQDGVVKTHTCWNVPVYNESLSDDLIEALLEKYYRPYHAQLSQFPEGINLGVDCHTMAAKGPPIGPDPGQTRPDISLSNADGTCPPEWLESLAECFSKAFEAEISINDPFKGGYIIRAHAKELPWVQLELSRGPFLTNREKGKRVLESLTSWCQSWNKAKMELPLG
jgi:N-formylglutamate deformylase